MPEKISRRDLLLIFLGGIVGMIVSERTGLGNRLGNLGRTETGGDSSFSELFNQRLTEIIEDDERVREWRPYEVNKMELNSLAYGFKSIGIKVKEIKVYTHFGSEVPLEKLLLETRRIESIDENQDRSLVISLPINSESTGWTTSVIFYAVIFDWAEKQSPGNREKFRVAYGGKLSEIAVNAPFRFKDESYPLPRPTPQAPAPTPTPAYPNASLA